MSRDKQIFNPANSQIDPITAYNGDVLPQFPSARPVPGTPMVETVTTGQAADVDAQKTALNMLSLIGRHLGLSQSLKSDHDLVTVIEAQLPVKAISALIKNGLQEKEVYSQIIPRRTLQHRRTKKERLSIEESDRAVRVARIIALAEQVFGDKNNGMRWLRSPKQRFAGRTAMEMLATEAGNRLVEEMLYQIDEGMAS